MEMDEDAGRVKEFWQSRAGREDIAEREVTHRDVWQRWLEIELISRFLSRTDRLLDVGCGNGYTTWQVASLVDEVVGIDYSDDMIRRARDWKADGSTTPDARITFAAGDVRALTPSAFGLFDTVLSERCLINLANWDEQRAAIASIATVLEPGGRFILVEGSRDGRDRLNALRASAGLEQMPPVWHNVDFDKPALLEFVRPLFDVESDLHFGVYDFLSRVVHPLVVAPAEPEYDSRINEVAARLALERQDLADLSRVVFLVLRKKAER